MDEGTIEKISAVRNGVKLIADGVNSYDNDVRKELKYAFGEVFKELKQRLEAEGLLPEEYFCLEYPEPYRPDGGAPFPEFRRLACYAVTGASEGHYVHVDALVVRRDLGPPLLQVVPVFLGKTFQGMDFACRVAAACARHLGA